MEIILVLSGLGIVIWAASSLFAPPKKHKFTLHDRDEATVRALAGGSGPPDLTKPEPTSTEQKREERQDKH